MRSSGLLFLMLSACATVPAQPPEIPVSQVGVAFDRNGNVGSFSEGLADPAAARAVTPDDPVRIASISKLVVGIGAMKLVEQSLAKSPRRVKPSEADGEDASKCIFGPFTKRAVETFQRQNGGLTIDGMAGIMTLRAMDVLLVTHFDSLFPDDPSL